MTSCILHTDRAFGLSGRDERVQRQATRLPPLFMLSIGLASALSSGRRNDADNSYPSHEFSRLG